MPTFTMTRPRSFRLAAASDFYASFTPGSGMAAAAVDRLTFAFRLDGSFEAVAVSLVERADLLVVEYQGTRDERTLERQIARMLGLDASAEGWRAVGERDPVVGALQAEFPGFFTAAKPSPYDAATWGMISPRTSMKQAARLKIAIAEQHGDVVELHGRSHHVFPSPEQLLCLDAFPGLSAEKLERLHGVALAALEGKLDAERLRAMPEEQALAELSTLRGVGPWTASHILLRGAALHDALPMAEPRVLHGLADAYGLSSASPATLERLSAAWRPFRMWVCVLLARHLARAGKWSTPGLAAERRDAGKRLQRRASSRRLSGGGTDVAPPPAR